MNLDEKKQSIEEMAKTHRLKMVLIFGSAATGKSHPQSDIDIAVKLSEASINFTDFADLQYDMQKIFPSGEVDLAIINYADPLFLKKIMETAILLYGNKKDLAELKIYAYKRYVDHQRYFNLEKNYVDKFIARRKTA